MQHRNLTVLTVQNVTVRLTHAPGSGVTQVRIEGQPTLGFWPADTPGLDPTAHDHFRLWDGPEGGAHVEPEGSARFKSELLKLLRQHTATRRAWYQGLKAGGTSGLHIQPDASGEHTVTFKLSANPDKRRELQRLIGTLLADPE